MLSELSAKSKFLKNRKDRKTIMLIFRNRSKNLSYLEILGSYLNLKVKRG
jgi:hypothetical protein